MSENPYEASSPADETATNSNGTPPTKKTSLSKSVILGALTLAVLAGISFATGVPANNELIGWLVIILPALALLLVSGNAVFRGSDRLMESAWRSLQTVTQIVLVAAAGYVAFAVTCCGIGASQIRSQSYMPPPIVGAIATFGCTLLGCWIVLLLHKAIRWMIPPRG